MTAPAEVENLKKTPLYEEHVRLGGKMVGFGGWNLPVYYSGIIAEHQWTRQSCSVFDVSHLGEIRIKGKGAFDFLQHRLTNDLGKLKKGYILYNLLCDENGGIIDDVLVCCEGPDHYYVIVNAANIEADYKAFTASAPASISIDNQSDRTACVAVQGPKAEAALEKMFGFSLRALPYYSFQEEQFLNQPVWISRSGYTGEDGFEIFSSNELSVSVWQKLLSEGKSLGVLPAGLGARNTLRLEAGNLLCGSDMNQTTTPFEAGLGFAVSLDKAGGFIGQEALARQKKEGVSRKLAAFKMLDKSIAREHYCIFKDGQRAGEVTSGSYAPTFGANIGLGYVLKGLESPGTEIDIEIHGRMAKAEIVRRPFVPQNNKKIKL